MTRVRRSATLLLALTGALCLTGPAGAAERAVTVGRDGVRPTVLRVAPGDTVRFVNEDRTFAYRAQSTGGAWRFDSGPTALLEGDFVVPAALTRPGTYTYRLAQDRPFAGTVVVAGAGAAAGPTAVPGPLAGPPSSRALGLAVTVAGVLLLGVLSLLLRLLLALPVLSDRTARL